MSDKERLAGHGAALFSILVWGTTFISTKVLLQAFAPVEILFLRFVLGALALTLLCPRRLKLNDRRQELTFAAAGLCGVTLYFLMENVALTYTLASNVGVIVAVSPLFTALLSRFIPGAEKLRPTFFVGLASALAGVAVITWGGSTALELNPVGDLLALLAALVWSLYSLLTRRIGSYGYGTVQATRRIFFYGLAFMLPALPLMGFAPELTAFHQPVNLLNLLYLGLGASALCFVTWNVALKRLGAVKTSVYIFLVPVITVATSALVLREPITLWAAGGTALTLAGLFLSEWRPKKGKDAEKDGSTECEMCHGD